jgi:hypothetical protein
LYWIFDKQGQIDKGLKSRVVLAMEFAFSAPANRKGKVVDLQPELKRKKFEEEHHWDFSDEELNRITADLGPDLTETEEVQTLKGKALKRPPLTYEAKHALSNQCQDFFSWIGVGESLRACSEGTCL